MYEQRNVEWFGVEYINGDQQRTIPRYVVRTLKSNVLKTLLIYLNIIKGSSKTESAVGGLSTDKVVRALCNALPRLGNLKV